MNKQKIINSLELCWHKNLKFIKSNKNAGLVLITGYKCNNNTYNQQVEFH